MSHRNKLWAVFKQLLCKSTLTKVTKPNRKNKLLLMIIILRIQYTT